MSESPIAVTIGIEEVIGTLLTGASMVLTIHSLSRMIFLRRSGSKFHLFPIINIAQFVNQFALFFLVLTPFNTISAKTALWLNVINNFAYFITKPATMYLAYLRCSAVYPQFRKFVWVHGFLIAFRAIELFGIVVVNIVQNYRCDGSVAVGTRCANLAIAWTFRDAGAPVFRFYYIVCEAIFYAKLFQTLQSMAQGKNVALIQYRRLQTTLFTVDLALLTFMSIYRIIGIFDTKLPTYVYYELFSSTLTIFNLTEFGLNIRILFSTVTDAKSTSETSSPSRLEMGSIQHSGNGSSGAGVSTMASGSGVGIQTARSIDHGKNAYGHDRNNNQSRPQQPMKHNSSSPLTSFVAETGYSDYDLSSATAVSTPYARSPKLNQQAALEYDDYIPYHNNTDNNNNNNSNLASQNAFVITSSPSSSSSSHRQLQQPQQQQYYQHQESRIIDPASFQQQSQSSFYDFSTATLSAVLSHPAVAAATVVSERDDRRTSVSRPGRALIPPERSPARRQ